jgi:hypothetical protein
MERPPLHTRSRHEADSDTAMIRRKGEIARGDLISSARRRALAGQTPDINSEFNLLNANLVVSVLQPPTLLICGPVKSLACWNSAARIAPNKRKTRRIGT